MNTLISQPLTKMFTSPTCEPSKPTSSRAAKPTVAAIFLYDSINVLLFYSVFIKIQENPFYICSLGILIFQVKTWKIYNNRLILRIKSATDHSTKH